MRKRLARLALGLGLLSGCGDQPAEAPAKQALRPFEGQSISVIVPKLDARLIRGPILDEVAGFEARTGAKVRVLTPGWNETIEKIDQSIRLYGSESFGRIENVADPCSFPV